MKALLKTLFIVSIVIPIAFIGCENTKRVLSNTIDVGDPTISFDPDVENPQVPSDIEVLETDRVVPREELPENALVFDDAAATIADEKVIAFFSESEALVEEYCQTRRRQGQTPNLVLYFTNREARTQFVSALPGGWYWTDEAFRRDKAWSASRTLIIVNEEEAYFSMGLRLHSSLQYVCDIEEFTSESDLLTIPFNPNIQNPQAPSDIEVLETDRVVPREELPENALVFDDAAATIADEKVIAFFSESEALVEEYCQTRRRQGQTPNLVLYFTNREARTQFVSALPGGWYWTDEAFRRDKAWSASRTLIIVNEEEAYFSMGLRLHSSLQYVCDIEEFTSESDLLTIPFNPNIQNPQVPTGVEVIETDRVYPIEELPEDALVFGDAATAIADEKVIAFFSESEAWIEEYCRTKKFTNTPRIVMFFTNRDARTQFVTELPGEWYWTDESTGSGKTWGLTRTLAVVNEEETFFSLAIKLWHGSVCE